MARLCVVILSDAACSENHGEDCDEDVFDFHNLFFLLPKFEFACTDARNHAAVDEQVSAGDELGMLAQQDFGIICQY